MIKINESKEFFTNISGNEYPCREISALVIEETYGNQYRVGDFFGKKLYKSPRKIASWNDLFKICENIILNTVPNIHPIYDSTNEANRKRWSKTLKSVIRKKNKELKSYLVLIKLS